MKVILVMLTNLNGKIAHDNDDQLKWGGKADKKFFQDKSTEIGTLIMGSTTFEVMGRKPLPNRRTIVLTRDPAKFAEVKDPNFSATAETPAELVQRLQGEGLEQVAVVGGGHVNASFFAAGLITEIYWSIAPVVFAPGIEVIASDLAQDVELRLLDSQTLTDETVVLHYAVKN